MTRCRRPGARGGRHNVEQALQTAQANTPRAVLEEHAAKAEVLHAPPAFGSSAPCLVPMCLRCLPCSTLAPRC